MTVSAPETNLDLYIYQETHIVRTGLLLYYDPLLMSDLVTSSLSSLNTVDSTLPSTDSAGSLFPSGINASSFTLTIG